VECVAFSPDGQRVVSGSRDRSVRIWDPSSGRELLTVPGHADTVWTAAFSPDGQRLATGSWDRTVKIWEATTGRELFTLRGHTDEIRSVTFSPDGQRVASGSGDRTIKLWEVTSGTELLTLRGHKAGVESVAFSPDGQRVVSGSSDRTIKLWEVTSGAELLTLQGHADEVRSVAFSSDGRRFVSGSADRTVKVWEAAGGLELLTLRGHEEDVEAVVFSPDGLRLVTGGGDRTIRVWEAASVQQLSAWVQGEQLAQERWAVRQQEKALQAEQRRAAAFPDGGVLQHWLILAPIPLRAGQSESDGLTEQQLAGEALLRPSPGQKSKVQSEELSWQEHHLQDAAIDFNALLGRTHARCVAYAVCYVKSPEAKKGLLLKVGSDDQSRVFLNGHLGYENRAARGLTLDEDTVAEVELEAGLNVVVFKVVNRDGPWEGSLRFTDQDGNPLRGLVVTLNPTEDGVR
jgi:dipeptidyl aminopeptidase/acylaminoacyl peptidase